MNFFTFIIALLGLTATADCDCHCTDVNNGTVTCASGNVFDNAIFKCVDLEWNYVEMCSDPYTRCLDGACVSTSSTQDLDHNVNNDDKHYNLPPVLPRENSIAAAQCKENELKCMAQNGQGKDGAVYKCTNGFWKIIQDCPSLERCVSKPVPHCAWQMRT